MLNSVCQKIGVFSIWFIPHFSREFPLTSIMAKAIELKFGMYLGFVNFHHEIKLRRKDTSMVMCYGSPEDLWFLINMFSMAQASNKY